MPDSCSPSPGLSWARPTSEWVWLYSALLSLSTALLGAGLLFLGLDWLTREDLLLTNIVHWHLLATGALLIVFVVVWNLFTLLSMRASRKVSRKVQSRAMPRARPQVQYRSRSCGQRSCQRVSWSLGLVSLTLLLVCLMLEVAGTGLLWWTSARIARTYEVRGDCFCHRPTAGSPRMVFEDKLRLCQVSSSSDMSCTTLYTAVPVIIRGLKLMTGQCQRVDLSSVPDPACRQFTRFSICFQVLRVLLPLLALFQLPILLVNCFNWAQVRCPGQNSLPT